MGTALDQTRRGYQLFDSGDMAGIADKFEELFTPDAEIRNPIGTWRGRDALVFWEGFRSAFEDMRHHILASAEEGNVLAIEGRLTGTHTGPLPTPDGGRIPPTGKRISVEFAHLVWRDGDRMSAWHVYFDTADFMAQLGLVPEPAAATA